MDNTPFLWEDPRRKPWERLPDEPDKQFHAFTIFRDLGHSRTLGEAYRRYADKPDAPKAQGYFIKWAGEWRWQERVEAYDRYMDSAKVEAQKEGYAEQYHERGKTLADIEADTIEMGHEMYQMAMRTIRQAEETMLAKDWNNLTANLVRLYETLSKVKSDDGPKPGEIPELTDEVLNEMFGTPEEQEERGEYS
jgi:hypothetical protein